MSVPLTYVKYGLVSVLILGCSGKKESPTAEKDEPEKTDKDSPHTGVSVFSEKLLKAFEPVVNAEKDWRGNANRIGSDEGTGWPLEIRHRSTGMHFVFVPAGRFMMGSEEDEKHREEVEGPTHEVILRKPFYMGKYEVAQREWQKVFDSNPSYFKNASRPVERVSWDDCQNLIEELNYTDELDTGELSFVIPTEAQWEYACRAGSETRFHYGNDSEYKLLADYAVYNGNAFTTLPQALKEGKRTLAVGSKKSNKWGFYDMHGNVYEWCQDWFGAYPKGPVNDPKGPNGGSDRVFRGGCWFNPAWRCRSALRDRVYSNSTKGTYSSVGVRLALVSKSSIAQ